MDVGGGAIGVLHGHCVPDWAVTLNAGVKGAFLGKIEMLGGGCEGLKGDGGVKPAARHDKEGGQSREGLSITTAYLSGAEGGSKVRTSAWN